MNFNGGDWIVEALNVVAQNLHLRIMAYGLILALLLWVVKWWYGARTRLESGRIAARTHPGDAGPRRL